jgi:hypothetical protein
MAAMSEGNQNGKRARHYEVALAQCNRRLALAAKIASGVGKTLGVPVLSDLTLAQAIDNIYTSIHANNEDLDLHIAALKAAMAREGAKEAVFEPAKLAQSNRQGRKIMQAYFKKKGVAVAFSA